MPLVYEPIDIYDVKVALKRKGYGLHSARGVALQLNIASTDPKKKRRDGVPLREPLRAIQQFELADILKHSESVEEAVLHIENLSLGKDLAPQETRSPVDSGLSAEQVAHLIDNRVGLKVQQELEPFRVELRSTLDELKLMLQAVPMKGAVEEEEPPKSSRRKKKAKKAKKGPHKPSPEEVDEAMKEMGLGGRDPGEFRDD